MLVNLVLRPTAKIQLQRFANLALHQAHHHQLQGGRRKLWPPLRHNRSQRPAYTDGDLAKIHINPKLTNTLRRPLSHPKTEMMKLSPNPFPLTLMCQQLFHVLAAARTTTQYAPPQLNLAALPPNNHTMHRLDHQRLQGQ